MVAIVGRSTHCEIGLRLQSRRQERKLQGADGTGKLALTPYIPKRILRVAWQGVA